MARPLIRNIIEKRFKTEEPGKLVIDRVLMLANRRVEARRRCDVAPQFAGTVIEAIEAIG